MTLRARISALCLVLAALSARAEIVDAIVATVDREVILRSEIMFDVAPIIQGMGAAEAEAAFRQALDQAVEFKILYREALLAGVKVEDADIEKRIQEITDQYPSYDEFLKALNESGESLSDFRERMKKQIMALRFGMAKRRAFEAEAVITENDLAQYYQDHADTFQKPERVRLQRIFLAADAASRARARAKLETLREEALLGADFSELARRHSEGPEKDAGGMMGWVSRGDLVPALEAAVFSLQEGDISAPIETEFGVQILKAVKREEAGKASFADVRTEIEPLLRKQYAQEHYAKWMGELKKRSRVRVFI